MNDGSQGGNRNCAVTRQVIKFALKQKEEKTMTQFENATMKMQNRYSAPQIVKINSLIHKLARTHYKYGKMPLVFGKARGITEVLRAFYNVDTSLHYVWSVLEEMEAEPQE